MDDVINFQIFILTDEKWFLNKLKVSKAGTGEGVGKFYYLKADSNRQFPIQNSLFW